MNKTYAIGDIHGCLDKLQDLLTRITPCKDDLIIFLGDYMIAESEYQECLNKAAAVVKALTLAEEATL